MCKLIDLLVPDIPESLDIKVKRERYLAKEALQDAEHVLQKVMKDADSDCIESDTEINMSPVLRKRPSQDNPHYSPCSIQSQNGIKPRNSLPHTTDGPDSFVKNCETNFSTNIQSNGNSPPALRKIVSQVTAAAAARPSYISSPINNGCKLLKQNSIPNTTSPPDPNHPKTNLNKNPPPIPARRKPPVLS